MNLYDDQPNVHRIPYLDNIAIVEADTYGLYSIRLERGITPSEFEGKFTSLARVEEIVTRTAATRKPRAKKQE